MSAHDELWVFGYGSLMWRPGFEYLERVPARLTGMHRALCVYSFVHRGTPEKPGLVMGLDRGGACLGVAFRVANARREQTIGYLREREQVTGVYIETWRQVDLIEGGAASGPARRVRALAYGVDRGHVQYAGKLSLEDQLHLIRSGHGRSGPNPEYVLSTVEALESLGIHDRDLHLLAQSLKGKHGPARPAGDDL